MVSFSRGAPYEFEMSERMPFSEDSDGSKHASGRDEPNFFEGTNIADPEPSTIETSCKEGALCFAPMNSPLNSSTPCTSWIENSNWVKRRMYRLEKYQGISYEGFEHVVLELFSTIKSSRKVTKECWVP